MKHRILLAGIGGDSHSVGLTLLNQALTLNDYEVTFLGIQNPFTDIIEIASDYDAILISNMDGHAHYYLKEIPKSTITKNPLWYLGGNISINKLPNTKELFQSLGFDFVFPDFVDVSHLLKHLKKNLKKILRKHH